MKGLQHGFTVLELMTALGIVGILLAISTPSLRSFSASSRIGATANTVVSALALARTEALRRSTPVAVCPSSDAQSCSSSASWSSGWLVFTDGSGTAGTVNGPTDLPIQAWSAVSGGVTVTLSALNGDKFVRFDARGMNSQGTTDTFVVTASACKGQNATQIVLTASGSPRTTKVACP